MKIGKLPRKIEDYVSDKPLTSVQMRILLLLSEVMWMGTVDMRYNLVVAKETVVRGLKFLVKKQLVKIARRESSAQSLDRKYAITQKGRIIVNDFFNHLNN